MYIKTKRQEVEDYFAGPFVEQWRQVYQEGLQAKEAGKTKEDNPHTLKVWKAVWGYGFDKLSFLDLLATGERCERD